MKDVQYGRHDPSKVWCDILISVPHVRRVTHWDQVLVDEAGTRWR